VLRLISGSPGELGAVFDAMLVNATRLCEAKFGILLLWEEDAFRTVALHNAPPAFAEHRRREPVIRPAPVTSLGRLVATKQVDHIADMQAEKAYVDGHPGPVSLVELAGARTVINVPMLKERELIGCCSNASFRSRVSRASSVSLPGAEELLERTTFRVFALRPRALTSLPLARERRRIAHPKAQDYADLQSGITAGICGRRNGV
jgi:hypothetical protein